MKTILTVVFVLFLSASVFAQSPSLWGYDPQTNEHSKYLGNLNQNPYDPNSVNNPYGRYGNKYGSDSIRNPYSPYGSPYSPYSPSYPYGGGQSPKIQGKKPHGRFIIE